MNLHVKQSELDKMPIIPIKELEKTSNSIRNYFVYIGYEYPVDMQQVHVGLESNNHYKTIKDLINGEVVYKVLLDNRKMK